ncbi:hypothetical protein DFI02_1168 [Rhizobium sp. PP-F2F-G20b]|nr:hypothetical protein DFI02_1168 [Rhizobium sp. PP-F2F-G20b]
MRPAAMSGRLAHRTAELENRSCVNCKNFCRGFIVGHSHFIGIFDNANVARMYDRFADEPETDIPCHFPLKGCSSLVIVDAFKDRSREVETFGFHHRKKHGQRIQERSVIDGRIARSSEPKASHEVVSAHAQCEDSFGGPRQELVTQISNGEMIEHLFGFESRHYVKVGMTDGIDPFPIVTYCYFWSDEAVDILDPGHLCDTFRHVQMPRSDKHERKSRLATSNLRPSNAYQGFLKYVETFAYVLLQERILEAKDHRPQFRQLRSGNVFQGIRLENWHI